MSFFESLFRFLVKAICGSSKPQDEGRPPYHHQQQQQHQQEPYVGQQNGQPVSYPPHHQQQQQQHGKPFHHNNYLANAQDPHYLSLRKEVEDLDEEMDRVFSASREAYQSGDGARAKELSDGGKKMKARQERLNREAAEWIFEKNNAGREPGEIDLHGLRADEAVERTDQFILDRRQKGITDLRLIVGKGNHSQNHHAVLKPRIEELMRKHNVVAEIDPDNSGVLLVHLDSGAPTRGRAIDPDEITRRLGDEDKGCIIM
ncbi:hypothetical protein ACEPAF_7555 [Sanghuangporus sanghuang]